MDFIIKGVQMASGKYQDSVHFLHVKAVPQRPDPGVVARLYGTVVLPTGSQHHIPRPLN